MSSNNLIHPKTLGAGLVLAGLVAGCGSDEDTNNPDPQPTTPGNIVEVASSAGSFSSLLRAATSAGLADTLASEGPFTVFAPTDAAFSALGGMPSAPDLLANILLSHVASGALDSASVTGRTSIESLANTALSVAELPLSSQLDIEADNGIIHVLDEVIVPPTILEVAQATSDLSTLVSAVGATSEGVQAALAPDTLSGDGLITVFAPTNDAFAASGIDLDNVPQATLDGVLAHHVVGAQALSTDLSDGQIVTTLNGNLTVEIDGAGNIGIIDGQGNKANVIATLKDIRTLTGVVHVIDAVLLP